MTAFHHACEEGHLEVAKMIMQRSAELKIELNSENNDGNTGFHLAAIHDRANIVEMIIHKSSELKIDIDSKSFCGWTAFHWACYGGYEEVVQIIKNNIKYFKENILRIQDNDGKTGYQIAKENKQYKVLEVLLKRNQR